MDVNRLVEYVENSFLRQLVLDNNITDITFNGKDIFYVDNEKGRIKSNIEIDRQKARDFIRQIANLSEKQFSFQSPNLEVSFGRYRLQALHQSICRKNNVESICFSFRLASSELRINENDAFLTPELTSLFDVLINSNVSIVLGGITGSGKTELQKYLISRMPNNTRVIVIDNILELDQIAYSDNLDLNIWQVDEKRDATTIQCLVRAALRSNPDWLIVAESRGKEMLEVLNSSLTGHPIITTIHAFDINSVPTRMVRMVMMNEQKMNFDDVYKDISYHLRFYVFLKRKYVNNECVKRYISSISYLNEDSMEEIYGSDGENHKFHQLSIEALKMLDLSNANELFKKTFLGGNK